MFRQQFYKPATLAILVSSFSGILLAIPQRAIADDSIPNPLQSKTITLKTDSNILIAEDVIPDIDGGPSGVEPAGPRSDCFGSQDLPFTALMPVTEKNVTLTSSTKPSFFFYVPTSKAKTAKFILWDENRTIIHTQTIAVENRSGVIEVPLENPDFDRDLNVGNSYRWSFSLICSDDDPAENATVRGWVQRIEVKPDLATQLDNASPRDRINLYANAGIWHETIATLAHLLETDPQDAILQIQWIDLLTSVGLNEDLAEQSLVSFGN